MLRGAILVGALALACGNDGSASGDSGDSGGAAGAESGGGTATGGSSPTGGSSGSVTGGSSGASSGTGGRGGAAGGEGGEAGSSAGDSGSGGGGGDDTCGGTAGPSMVALEGFCIDSTEVTNTQYQAFLDAVNPGLVAAQPPACAWNDAFEPNTPNGNGEDELPVRGVDWCDAHAFCAWAGKRLCGSSSGGAATYDEPSNEDQSQWFSACSANGTKAFPYGDAYDAQACNGADYGGAEVGALPVGSIATCVGGYPGIYDMSGNAWEWEDSCNASAGEADLCRARGGAFGNGGNLHRCDYSGFSPARNFNLGPTGIRCCSR